MRLYQLRMQIEGCDGYSLVAGQVAINHTWNYQIQANTVRDTAVLSIAFIGIHVLRNLKFYKLKKIDILDWAQYECSNI